MKKNIFKLILCALLLPLAGMAYKKDKIDFKEGKKLIKKTTKNAEGHLLSYSKLIYDKKDQLNQINTYDESNRLTQSLKFGYDNEGSLVSITKHTTANNEKVNIIFKYDKEGRITSTQNQTIGQSEAIKYALTYSNNALTQIKIIDNPFGDQLVNDINYNTDGKITKQSNAFYTGGSAFGQAFNIDFEDKGAIEYIEYYDQSIKPVIPQIGNLLVKYYPKKVKIGDDIKTYHSVFNSLGNPTKIEEKDMEDHLISTTTYEYE